MVKSAFKNDLLRAKANIHTSADFCVGGNLPSTSEIKHVMAELANLKSTTNQIDALAAIDACFAKHTDYEKYFSAIAQLKKHGEACHD